MKKGTKAKFDLRVSTGTAEDFFKRSLDRARKLDRGEKLPVEMRLTFEDPTDLARALTTQRVRVLTAIRIAPRAVSDLAVILKRDRKAVSRDVEVLESLGLLRTHKRPNPGHGSVKIVEPLAARYQLLATI